MAFESFKCGSCGGVSRALKPAHIKRRRWTEPVPGKFYCPKPACQAVAVTTGAILPRGDYFAAMHDVFKAFAQEFVAVFRVPLKQYWDVATGLDVTTLDADVVKSGDRCMLTVARLKFGPAAPTLLKRIAAAEKLAVETSTRIPYNA